MAGTVRTYRETLDSPQVKANDSFIAEIDKSGATAAVPRPAYRLSPDFPPGDPARARAGRLHRRATCARSESRTGNSTSSSSPESSPRPPGRADDSKARPARCDANQ